MKTTHKTNSYGTPVVELTSRDDGFPEYRIMGAEFLSVEDMHDGGIEVLTKEAALLLAEYLKRWAETGNLFERENDDD